MFPIRTIAVALALSSTGGLVHAQSPARAFPIKPVRIVVPYPAGGPIDMLTRPLAQKMNEGMNNPVLVDNRAGANGIIGIEHAARSPADGYTLVVGSAGSFAINPNVYAKLPFDVVRDFAPVSLFATVPELLVVHPALPAKSVKELVALAKARPRQLNYGSSGIGGTPHLAVELLKQAAGMDVVHVPYKGMGPATIDLIAGQVQIAFADLPVLLQHVKAGKLRALAVSTSVRSSNLPETPTMAESGYPKINIMNWYALFVPAATPKDIVGTLNAETAKVVARADMKTFVQEQGGASVSNSPGELGSMLRAELDMWSKVVKTAGVKLD
ncbi:MAG TPA: tripartite tricarboxylate transporter substrate binding protein [Burkholderiales bacterium]|nr:tripartite tricarboxylate transporter substrate binding protein [Burkholderiales bacterium]